MPVSYLVLRLPSNKQTNIIRHLRLQIGYFYEVQKFFSQQYIYKLYLKRNKKLFAHLFVLNLKPYKVVT